MFNSSPVSLTLSPHTSVELERRSTENQNSKNSKFSTVPLGVRELTLPQNQKISPQSKFSHWIDIRWGCGPYSCLLLGSHQAKLCPNTNFSHQIQQMESPDQHGDKFELKINKSLNYIISYSFVILSFFLPKIIRCEMFYFYHEVRKSTMHRCHCET